MPTEQPVTGVDTASSSSSAEVGDEAAAEVRPGESDEELAQLDEQAAAGTSGGAVPAASESAPQSEATATEPDAATPDHDAAADVTAEAGPEPEGGTSAGEHPASAPSSAAGAAAPSGADSAALDTGPAGPDPDAEEAQQEEQFRIQDAHAAEGEVEADRGLAEASEQEAVEAAAETQPQGATAEVAGDTASAGDSSSAAPTSDDPSQIQAEAGSTVDSAGEDMSGEGAADAAGGGGAGGGGGDSSPDTAPPAPPDLSGADPAQALTAAAALPPAQLAGSLATVAAGASRVVSEQRSELAANPPEVQRGAGAAGITAPSAPSSGLPAVSKAAERSPVAVPQPRSLPAAPAAPVERARTPQVPEAADGKVSANAARDVQSAVRTLPTSDPGLAVTPGAPPRLPLAGDADLQQVGEQQAHLDQSTGQAAAQGQRDAATPMGEDRIYPTVPAVTLRGEVSSASGAAPTAASAAAAVGDAADTEAVSVVAQQEKGDEIRGAVTQGTAQITGAKAEHARQSTEERQRSAQEVAGLEQTHAQEQAAERTQANAEVQAHRRQWTDEQATLVASHRAEAGTVAGNARQSVVQEQTQAEQEATAHHQAGEEEAGQARQEGEQEAARARREGEQESSGGGFFSWAASAMKSLVDKVKNGIKAAFDKARAAVRAAIQKAQQLATAVIERARQAVVAAIRVAGAALIAIGDRLLAAFPAVRDRFRKAIQDRVKAAEAAVNRLAEGLARGVKNALDLLGKGLDAALGLLEKGMLAAVDAVHAAVKGALDFAKKAIEALGTFAVIAKDIVKGPGRWLSMLGSSVVSGIRNHLWEALKKSIKEWFNSKVEEVTGLGQMVWNLLTKGGISLAKVGKMVWQGIVAAIPAALIAILIEKLVSMIVPAAGAVLAILQGLQAAWGAIQRIIQAISAFVAFLKGVLGGSGPVLFAAALAAAAVAVIEFVAQWLLRKLKGAAKGVGGKLREIAKRIGQRLKTIGKAVAGGARRAAGAAMRAVTAVGRGVVRGAKAVGRGIVRGARYIGRKLGRFGAAMGRGIRGAAAAMKKQWQKLKAKLREWRDKLKKKWEDWKNKREERAEKARQDRLAEAARELPPVVAGVMNRGVGRLGLLARQQVWRLRYRLRSVSTEHRGHEAVVVARTTQAEVGKGIRKLGDELHMLIRDVAENVLLDNAVLQQIDQIRQERAQALGSAPGQPRPAQSSAAESGALIFYPRAPNTKEHILLGGQVIAESQTRTSGAGHIQTWGLGRGHYPAIAAKLATIKAALTGKGVTNPDEVVASAVLNINRGGTLPPALSGRKGIRVMMASLTRLLLQVEPGRSPSALVTNIMALETAAGGQANIEKTATELNTMAPEGAGAEARAAGKSVAYPVPSEARTPASGPAAARFLEREKRTAIAWVYTLVSASQPMFATDAQWQQFIAKELRDFLLAHVRKQMGP